MCAAAGPPSQSSIEVHRHLRFPINCANIPLTIMRSFRQAAFTSLLAAVLSSIGLLVLPQTISAASIFFPPSSSSTSFSLRSPHGVGSSNSRGDADGTNEFSASYHNRRMLNRAISQQQRQRRHSSNGLGSWGGGVGGINQRSHHLAMAIPGSGPAEQILFGGFSNFLSIYNTVITARILLTWFPAISSNAALSSILNPVYAVTDPYLNLFRGLLPPVFGLDFSPMLAFVTLNLAQGSMVSLAATIPEGMKPANFVQTKMQPVDN